MKLETRYIEEFKDLISVETYDKISRGGLIGSVTADHILSLEIPIKEKAAIFTRRSWYRNPDRRLRLMAADFAQISGFVFDKSSVNHSKFIEAVMVARKYAENESLYASAANYANIAFSASLEFTNNSPMALAFEAAASAVASYASPSLAAYSSFQFAFNVGKTYEWHLKLLEVIKLHLIAEVDNV